MRAREINENVYVIPDEQPPYNYASTLYKMFPNQFKAYEITKIFIDDESEVCIDSTYNVDLRTRIKIEDAIKSMNESMGAGFSMSSAKNMFRGRGAGGLGGANMMYTYEVKPLNHTLEPKRSTLDTTKHTLKIGAKVKGNKLRTNANGDKIQVKGILKNIKQTDNGSIMYYEVFDENTATLVKCDPVSTKLIVYEPTTNSKLPDISPRRKF